MDYYQKLEKIKAVIEKQDSPFLAYLSIKAIIVNHPKPEKYSRYTLDEIAHQIKEFTGVTMDLINQDTHCQNVVLYRQIAHYKATKFTCLPLDQIGKYFGQRNKGTVLKSKRKIQNLLETDKRFREQYETFLNN